MTDITMCANDNCPLNKQCYRFTAHKNELWQSYANFEYAKGGCAFFINNRDWQKKEKK